MNKKLLLVLAMVLLVVGLVACGKEPKTDETDPFDVATKGDYAKAYKEKVAEIEKAHKAEQTKILEDNPDYDITQFANLAYDLVYIDDDDIPELVVTNPGYYTALYTYADGKVVYCMKDEMVPDDEHGWAYGAGGNAGYEYSPRINTIRNYNNDYAGLIRYINYSKLDATTHQLVSVYDKELKMYFFEDKNNNGELDENEADAASEEATAYYFGTEKLTEEEFNAKIVDEFFDDLAGKKSASEMNNALDSLIATVTAE